MLKIKSKRCQIFTSLKIFLNIKVRGRKYLTFFRFFKLYLPWFDLLSVIPFYLEIVMVAMSKTSVASTLEHQRSHENSSELYTVLRVSQ